MADREVIKTYFRIILKIFINTPKKKRTIKSVELILSYKNCFLKIKNRFFIHFDEIL